ncbi:MAG TPA: hypothetical protein VKA59_21080 [Vicinamibacterales bacterium]|nr:hypothetical protein [Vicinamibacterales bacterium]
MELNTHTSTGLALEQLVNAGAMVEGVREADLQLGDWVIVRTRNSTYALRANGDGTFEATGGWFMREPQSGARVRIAGCTWGGSALLTRMVAAPGMFLEFTNQVRTTRIREVRVLRPCATTTVH